MTDEQFMAYGLIFQKTINALSVDRKTKGVIGVYRLTTKFKARLRYGAMVKTGCDAATLPVALDEIERQRLEIEDLKADNKKMTFAIKKLAEIANEFGCKPNQDLGVFFADKCRNTKS